MKRRTTSVDVLNSLVGKAVPGPGRRAAGRSVCSTTGRAAGASAGAGRAGGAGTTTLGAGATNAGSTGAVSSACIVGAGVGGASGTALWTGSLPNQSRASHDIFSRAQARHDVRRTAADRWAALRKAVEKALPPPTPQNPWVTARTGGAAALASPIESPPAAPQRDRWCDLD